jgi:hypothetical protein
MIDVKRIGVHSIVEYALALIAENPLVAVI